MARKTKTSAKPQTTPRITTAPVEARSTAPDLKFTALEQYDAIQEACSAQPHAILGLHPLKQKQGKGLVARAFLSGAKSCELVDADSGDKRYPLERISQEGFFEGQIPDCEEVFEYRLRVEQDNGEIRQFYDPYSFLPTLGEQDLYWFNEGTDTKIYDKLGSQVRTVAGVAGVSFAVWAPSARRVSVVGEFNAWDGRYHPMRSLGNSGVWEIFIPGLASGQKYKFEIIGPDGHLRLKSDPYALRYEPPPHNASVIHEFADYEWGDQAWLAARASTDIQRKPMSVYEVHLGSWRRVVEDGNRPLTYREMAVELVDYVKKMGFTHIELMPPAEHPFAGSWGYQVTGFFAPTQRFGTPEDFMYLVDTCHQAGIGVIVDWVPGHFPKDAFALAEFDGSHLYEHADPRQGYHEDWGTLIFNYGRHEVRCFLIASALSWFDRFHIDGLRVDAVASMLYLDYSRKEGEWIPNQYGGRENIEAIEFLRRTNELVHELYPGAITIAEESTAFGGVTKPVKDYGLGFDFKWNMGWMHDSLEYFAKDPIHRRHHHGELTFGILYQYSEHFTLVYSHDEVVHGKGSMLMKMSAGSIPGKAQSLRALYGLMWAWPGKKTLFMGQEWGQSSEWRYDGSLDWHLLQYLDHEGIQRLIADLNRLYLNEAAMSERENEPEAFQWIDCTDADRSLLSFVRFGKEEGDCLLFLCNFTPVSREAVPVGLPMGGYWKEILNTDSTFYGGQNQGNDGGVMAEPGSMHGRDFCGHFHFPGMSTLVFKLEG